MKERLLFRGLFWGMVALLLVPVWSVGTFPTTDGPSHVYNSWILRQYGNVQEYPLFQQYYEIDWRPIPNWLSHAVLALLMFPLDPRTAEKVLVSGCVVLFAGAARFLAGSVDPDRRWLAWLALPLIYNNLLQLGFYNFCLSVGFCLLAIGTWWRHRDRPDPGLALKLNLLLLLCWFSHIVSLVVALASIGVLWLVTLRGRSLRRHLVHVAILAPQILLPIWFLRSQEGGAVPSGSSAGDLWVSFLRLQVLDAFGEQAWIGTAVAVLFLELVILTLVRRGTAETREADGFLLLGLLAAVLYFMSPDGMAGGMLLKERLSLYPWLLAIPGLAPRLGNRGRAAVLAVVGAITVGQAGLLVHRYRQLQPEIRAFVAAAEAIPEDSRVLPLLFKRATAVPGGALQHALGYLDAEKGLVDWSNYEAMTGHFPVRFRREAGLSDIHTLETHPDRINFRAYKERTDAVFTWRMPPGARMSRVLGQQLRLVAERGPARLYLRKGRARRPAELD